MSRIALFGLALAALGLAACGHFWPMPSVRYEHRRRQCRKAGQSIAGAFGEPRKIDQNLDEVGVRVVFAAEAAGAPAGFHGCEMEVTVDARSQTVLGYSLSNIGWSNCGEVERKFASRKR